MTIQVRAEDDDTFGIQLEDNFYFAEEDWLSKSLIHRGIDPFMLGKISQIRFFGVALSTANIKLLSFDSIPIASLHFAFCSLQSDDCLYISNVLCNISTLEDLSVANNEITDKGIEMLCRNLFRRWKANGRSLKSLDISSNLLTDASIHYLEPFLPFLVKIEMENIPGITHESMLVLARVLGLQGCALKHVNISETQIRDEGVRILFSALDQENCQLEILEMEGVHASEHAFANILAYLKTSGSIKELQYSLNKIPTSESVYTYFQEVMDVSYTIREFVTGSQLDGIARKYCSRNAWYYRFWSRLSMLFAFLPPSQAELKHSLRHIFHNNPLMDPNILHLIFSLTYGENDCLEGSEYGSEIPPSLALHKNV